MFRVAIIAFLVSYCNLFFSQISYSRVFEARKKNVPIAMINNHINYFYLLRYNKAVHDITLEKRAKPSAEIISFTPLKLDVINADWFDYEKLDYLLFEHNHHVYFLFEKILNSKKTLYLKVIDTLGKASEFIELVSAEQDKGVTDINFEFKKNQNNTILIIGSQMYGNTVVKKMVLLFDIEKRKISWTKKLPIENFITGYSTAFECNETNDLFYVLIKSHVASFKRKYINNAQVNVPVLFFDSLNLVNFLNNGSALIKKNLAVSRLSTLNSIRLVPVKQEVSVIMHFSIQDSVENTTIYFMNQKFSSDLSKEFYANLIPMYNSIKESLTFYDGTDFKAASDKEYRHLVNFDQNKMDYQISERVDGYYYKELLVWRNDLDVGNIYFQKIIPRKVSSFQGRTRFKNMAKAMTFMYDDKLNVVVLEASPNLSTDPNTFNYNTFKKETNLWNSNIVMYTLNHDGNLQKKLLYKNANYDAVPMPYQSNGQREMILYLNNSKSEKFCFLKLD